jgi:hypothetical protein
MISFTVSAHVRGLSTDGLPLSTECIAFAKLLPEARLRCRQKLILRHPDSRIYWAAWIGSKAYASL